MSLFNICGSLPSWDISYMGLIVTVEAENGISALKMFTDHLIRTEGTNESVVELSDDIEMFGDVVDDHEMSQYYQGQEEAFAVVNINRYQTRLFAAVPVVVETF